MSPLNPLMNIYTTVKTIFLEGTSERLTFSCTHSQTMYTIFNSIRDFSFRKNSDSKACQRKKKYPLSM